jgi:[ribosomal protein S5]-alanine N-acetyltransferase
MVVLETKRLIVRRLTVDDAPFILELLNEPAFLRFIGDRGVRSEADAVKYITDVPLASYAKHGFGMFRVELKETGEVLGLCGLLQRDSLDAVDIGFAFLQRYWGKGYAYESASAMMDYARKVVGLTRLVAITAPDNESSRRVLEKIGLRFDRMIDLPEYDEPSRLFTWGTAEPPQVSNPAQ